MVDLVQRLLDIIKPHHYTPFDIKKLLAYKISADDLCQTITIQVFQIMNGFQDWKIIT